MFFINQKEKEQSMSQPEKVKKVKPLYKSFLEQILSVLEGSREQDGIDGLYCAAGKNFSLDMMTAKEERMFRKALAKTKLSVISLPIGKDNKKRFRNLFEDGKTITSVIKDNGRSVLYIPTKTFQSAWCKDGKAPSYIHIVG